MFVIDNLFISACFLHILKNIILIMEIAVNKYIKNKGFKYDPVLVLRVTVDKYPVECMTSTHKVNLPAGGQYHFLILLRPTI